MLRIYIYRERERAIYILAELCEEWLVKVNVEKCGVMYLRRKGVSYEI